MDIWRIPYLVWGWFVGLVKLEIRLILAMWPQLLLMMGIIMGVGLNWDRISDFLGNPPAFWYMMGYIYFVVLFSKFSDWFETTNLYQKITLDNEKVIPTPNRTDTKPSTK